MAGGGSEGLAGESGEGGSAMWLKVWVDPEDVLIDEDIGQVYVPVDLGVALDVFTKKKKAARAATRAAITLRLVK